MHADVLLGKRPLARRCYVPRVSRPRSIDLYRFLGWILRLPDDLELQDPDATFAIEEGLKRPDFSFVERRGQALGAARVVRDQLEQRFGTLPPEIAEPLERADPERLLAWSRRVRAADSLAEVFAEGPLPGTPPGDRGQARRSRRRRPGRAPDRDGGARRRRPCVPNTIAARAGRGRDRPAQAARGSMAAIASAAVRAATFRS